MSDELRRGDTQLCMPSSQC